MFKQFTKNKFKNSKDYFYTIGKQLLLIYIFK